MIPVDYILREDSLLATINPADIEESENQVTSVALAPFFCAAENDADNSWMLIPSGSGTLIYPKTLSQQGTNYSAQVYGEDASIEKWDMPSSEKSCGCPYTAQKRRNSGFRRYRAGRRKRCDKCDKRFRGARLFIGLRVVRFARLHQQYCRFNAGRAG